MADQDPYAATAIQPPASTATVSNGGRGSKGGDPYAATAIALPAPVPPSHTVSAAPAPSQRDRFLNPALYPVGDPNESFGQNLYNIAQRAGVGVFQAANAAIHPRQTVASILSSILPEPAVQAVNRVVDLENRIPGAHYLTAHLPEGTTNPIQQAYQALVPGGWKAAGNAAPVAGQALAGEAFGATVPAITSDLRAGTTSLARAAADTGDAPVRQLVKDTQRANEKIDAVNQDRLAAQQKAQAAADAEHRSDLLKLRQRYDQQVRDAQEKARTGTDADRADYQARQLAAKQKYDQAVRDAQAKYADRRAATDQANAQAQRDYLQSVGKVAQRNRAADAAEAARRDSVAQTQVVGSQLIYRLNQLDRGLRDQANSLYSAVRDRMADAALPSDTLADAVRAAQEKWIRGSPTKVQEFNAMLGQGAEASPELTLANQTAQNLGYKDFRAAIANPQMRETLSRALPPDVWQAATTQGSRPVSWNNLQGFYEETGARLAEGPQAGKGDIYKALQQVHDYVGDQMQQLADQRGAGADFRNARSFYRDYMNTFHEPTGPSGSGSPIAQVLRAKDPQVAIARFAGPAGDRGVALLRRYDPQLADLAQQARGIKQASATRVPARQAVGAPPTPAPAPAGPALPLPPVLESVPAPRVASLPLPPILPPPETIPVELLSRKTISAPDIVAARRAAAEARAENLWTRGKWAAAVPVFQAMRAFWGGHIPSIPMMGMETAGVLATVRAATELLRYPPMMDFLTKARPEDVNLVPPDLRGDLPGLVSLAQRQGIKVAPALATAAAIANQGSRQGQPSQLTQPPQPLSAQPTQPLGGAQ